MDFRVADLDKNHFCPSSDLYEAGVEIMIISHHVKFADHKKTKRIPKSSANAVVVSVAGLVTVAVEHWPSTKSP